jgi:hypothetical protein
VTDRTVLNLLALLHDRLDQIPDSPERNALRDALAALVSAIERPNAVWKNDWNKEAEQSLKAENRPAPDIDDSKNRQKTWNDAEAAGLGWPGPFWPKLTNRSLL